jgi:hypothetical protein
MLIRKQDKYTVDYEPHPKREEREEKPMWCILYMILSVVGITR